MAINVERVVKLVNSHGFVVIDTSDFFGYDFDDQSYRLALDALLDSLTPVDDQAGALRYHLSGQSIGDFLDPWLYCPGLNEAAQIILESRALQLNYIRYREPYFGQGLQKLHRDWNIDHSQKRLEMFVAFDFVKADNGCTQVIDKVTGFLVPVVLNPGSVALIDSTVLHRGTRNRSGDRRRMVSLQIGPIHGVDSLSTGEFYPSAEKP